MRKFYQFYILLFILMSDFALFAQPGDDDGGGGLEDDDPPASPINAKLIWLALIGILFVYFTLNKKYKKA